MGLLPRTPGTSLLRISILLPGLIKQKSSNVNMLGVGCPFGKRISHPTSIAARIIFSRAKAMYRPGQACVPNPKCRLFAVAMENRCFDPSPGCWRARYDRHGSNVSASGTTEGSLAIFSTVIPMSVPEGKYSPSDSTRGCMTRRRNVTRRHQHRTSRTSFLLWQTYVVIQGSFFVIPS